MNLTDLMCQYVLAQKCVLLMWGLVAGRRERRGEPAHGVARQLQRARQPAQRELHVIRRKTPAAVLINLANFFFFTISIRSNETFYVHVLLILNLLDKLVCNTYRRVSFVRPLKIYDQPAPCETHIFCT